MNNYIFPHKYNLSHKLNHTTVQHQLLRQRGIDLFFNFGNLSCILAVMSLWGKLPGSKIIAGQKRLKGSQQTEPAKLVFTHASSPYFVFSFFPQTREKVSTSVSFSHFVIHRTPLLPPFGVFCPCLPQRHSIMFSLLSCSCSFSTP